MSICIGVTSFIDVNSGRDFIGLSYVNVNSIINAGCTPVIIPNVDDEKVIDRYMDVLDGVVFTGGGDVNPAMYGEQPQWKINNINPKRDMCERLLFEKAMKKKIPVFGICRGCQFINVMMGGTLYQDIPSQIANSHGHSPSSCRRDVLYHTVDIVEDSRLYDVLKKKSIGVNSFHHQAIRALGNGLRITAYSTGDGIIEGIESVDDKLIMGVQWHPEDLTEKYDDAVKLYNEFAARCAEYKKCR